MLARAWSKYIGNLTLKWDSYLGAKMVLKGNIRNRKSFHSISSPRRPILAIECSCDDTAAAIVTQDRKVLADIVLKQDDLHMPWGVRPSRFVASRCLKSVQYLSNIGIVPRLAGQAHAERIDSAIEYVMQKSNLTSFADYSAVAFTRGPGLSPSLQVGKDKAASIATHHNLPLLGINHMEGHALAIRLEDPSVTFPFLALLVSGGHSQILVVDGVGKYRLLGETQDIAVGDAFDKAARLLKVGVINGGKHLEERAKQGTLNPDFKFVLPMLKHVGCNLSFSGLGTALCNKVMDCGGIDALSEQDISDLCFSFQHTAFTHITRKLSNGIQWCEQNLKIKVSHIVVSGGVACNNYLFRLVEQLAINHKLSCVRPSPYLCQDNAIMIGWAAQENMDAGLGSVSPEGLRYIPRWLLDPSGIDYFLSNHDPKAITAFTRQASLDNVLIDIGSNPTTPAYNKAVKLAMKLGKIQLAAELSANACKLWPTNDFLIDQRDSIQKQYESWRNKYE